VEYVILSREEGHGFVLMVGKIIVGDGQDDDEDDGGWTTE